MIPSNADKPSIPAVAAALARAAGATLRPSYDTIDAPALAELLASTTPPTVVDVRLVEDHAAGHIDGALNVPFADVAEHLDAIPTGATIVTVCYRGMLSRTAAQQLVAAGHPVVLNLDGGMRAWRAHLEGPTGAAAAQRAD